MREYEINCINKPNRNSTHEQVTHVGHNLHRWRLTHKSVISRIDSKSEAFYLLDVQTNQRIYLAVVRQQGQPTYLRAQANGKWMDRLLDCDECKGSCKTL